MTAMGGSRWAAFAVCAGLAACGGAIVPSGDHDDGGGTASSSGSGSSSGGISGSSSGPVGSGSSGSGSSSGGSSGGSSSSGSGSGSTSSGGVSVDAAFACTGNVPPPMTGDANCDTCIEGFCGNEWCACAGDSSIDDAGTYQGCIGFVVCVQTCVYPADGGAGGSVQRCAMECEGGYTAQQTQEGASLLSCLVASCASLATCGE